MRDEVWKVPGLVWEHSRDTQERVVSGHLSRAALGEALFQILLPACPCLRLSVPPPPPAPGPLLALVVTGLSQPRLRGAWGSEALRCIQVVRGRPLSWAWEFSFPKWKNSAAVQQMERVLSIPAFGKEADRNPSLKNRDRPPL